MRSSESLKEMLDSTRPSRDSVTHRIKGETLYQAQNLNRKEIMDELASVSRPGTIYRPKHDDHADALAFNITNKQENTTMSKTNDFVTSIKGIFGATVRMQRGRAMVHAAKRVIFKAFPIQWGILSRVTGKAKKFEDHALTDVAVALVLHGAANALLEDPKKRATYLQYTEEMVAAAVASAGFKMVPVEEILDKVLNGALDSEAVAKLKSALGDKAE